MPLRWTPEAPGVTVRGSFTSGEDMAKNALAAKATKKAAKKAAKKATKVPAKKVAAKPATKPPPNPAKPPRKPPPPRSGPGPVTFTVRVGQASLTMEYDGGVAQDYEMVLFVKDEKQAQRAQECIDELGLRKLVVAIAKAYVEP